MKTIVVKKTDKEGKELGSFELVIPESYTECAANPGEERALTMVVNQMKIEARAKNFPGEGKQRGLVSKSTMSAIRAGIKDSEFSEEDLIAFLRAKRGA